MPTDRRTAGVAVLLAKVLVVVLLLVSPRALLQPVDIVHKSQDSKRPKTPKNIVRAEPLRVPMAEKQGHSPTPTDAGVDVATPTWSVAVQSLPRKAFTQLTKPEYLKSYTSGLPPIPLAPPA